MFGNRTAVVAYVFNLAYWKWLTHNSFFLCCGKYCRVYFFQCYSHGFCCCSFSSSLIHHRGCQAQRRQKKQCHKTVPTTFYYFLKIVPFVQENVFQYRKRYIENVMVFCLSVFLTLDQPLFIVAFHFIKKEQLGYFTQGTGKWVV